MIVKRHHLRPLLAIKVEKDIEGTVFLSSVSFAVVFVGYTMQQEQAVPQQPQVLSASQLLEHEGTKDLKGFRRRWLGDHATDPVTGNAEDGADEFAGMLDDESFIQPTTPAMSARESVTGVSDLEVVPDWTGPIATPTNTDTTVDRRFIGSLDLNFIKLPWETGVMKRIFGDDSLDLGLTMQLLEPGSDSW